MRAAKPKTRPIVSSRISRLKKESRSRPIDAYQAVGSTGNIPTVIASDAKIRVRTGVGASPINGKENIMALTRMNASAPIKSSVGFGNACIVALVGYSRNPVKNFLGKTKHNLQYPWSTDNHSCGNSH